MAILNNESRMYDYLNKIISNFHSLKEEYNTKHLFIVSDDIDFTHSVSIVNHQNRWIHLEEYVIDLSDGNAFGIEEFGFEIDSHPIGDLFWLERKNILDKTMTMWFLEAANQTNLKDFDESIYYSSNSHFEHIWNLKNWKGPVGIGNIEQLQ